MMEDEYDIYGDLEGFEKEAAQDNKVVQELNAQIAELRKQIAEKELEKQDTIARNTVLLENISSLLVTAKAELKRKDALIADIRRDRDNAAFRRKRIVQRHDQATQTTLVRMLSGREEQQTEVDEPPQRAIKREKPTDWRWERKRVEEEDHRRERDRFKARERVPVRERLGERAMMRHERRGRGGRAHDEERERERQARRGPRSPEAVRHPVKFRSPVRVKAEESSVPDSASDIELSRAFIPMNRKELDRYVKEIGREQNRSPVVEVTKQDKSSKPLSEVSGAELWDTRPRRKSKTPKKSRKLARKTPVKQKSPAIIQSDEIGTTACASSVFSPVKSEDIEQRMSALHGHPPLPEPVELVIPPPEPPIIEQVPELPQEDEDARLNDSRELKIIESGEELVTTRGESIEEDVRNSSTETVIERPSLVEDEEALEDGEIITPAPSPAPPSKADIVEAKRNAKIAKAIAQLAQETSAKLEQEETSSKARVKEKSAKLKRKRADRSPKVDRNAAEAPKDVVAPSVEEPTPEPDNTKHKRNLNGAFELNAAVTLSSSTRRNTFSGTAINARSKRKQRLSEPGSAAAVAAAPKVAKKKTEALHELFGSDDESSFAVAPEEGVSIAHGKRKRTESTEEALESKKSRKVEVVEEEEEPKENTLTEEKRSAGSDESEKVVDVCKDEDEPVVEDEEMKVAANESDLGEHVLRPDAENEEVPVDKTVPEDNSEVLKSDSAISVDSKEVPESESTESINSIAQSVGNEVASESEPALNDTEVPENEVEPVPSQDVPPTSEDIDDSQIEIAITANVEEDKPTSAASEDTLNHPHVDVIVVSNKYCEYRIEDDNEAETTFFVTRKKKKKTKSKSRNASLNASGAN